MKLLLITILYFGLFIVCFGCITSSTQTPLIPTNSPSTPDNLTKSNQYEIQQVILPQDSTHHNSPVEWWYFNGNLKDESGNLFSYHFTTFQLEQDLDGSYPQLFHLSWHDHQKETVFHAEKSLQKYGSLPEDFIDFRVSAWQMTETKNLFTLYFNTPEHSIELQLRKTKKPILHNGTGFVDMKEAGQTYYYTYSSLPTLGEISSSNKVSSLEGISWMDHQWGDFLSNQQIGWDWFSINLENDHELMIAYVTDSATKSFITSYGTYIDPMGNSLHLNPKDFTLEALQTWKSPQTSASYPIEWDLSVPSIAAKLVISAMIPNSEFYSENNVTSSYWEGGTKIDGVINGNPISGYGFMELVGY